MVSVDHTNTHIHRRRFVMLQSTEEMMTEEPIYLNPDDIDMDHISKPASMEEGKEEYVTMRSNLSTQKPITSTMSDTVQTKRWSLWVTVAVGLLCVVLLCLTTGLCVRYTSERDQLRTERDLLHSRCNALTQERDQLRTERDLLYSRGNALTQEMEQLLISNFNLTRERDQLQAINKQLQIKSLQPKSPCPSEWVHFQCKCYRVSLHVRNWSEARKVCQAMQADLLIINDRDEQVFINELGKWGWIGLQWDETWKWVDNTPMSTGTEFWEPGQPNSNTENCVLSIPNDRNPTSTWHDYPCSSEFYPICERSTN